MLILATGCADKKSRKVDPNQDSAEQLSSVKKRTGENEVDLNEFSSLDSGDEDSQSILPIEGKAITCISSYDDQIEMSHSLIVNDEGDALLFWELGHFSHRDGFEPLGGFVDAREVYLAANVRDCTVTMSYQPQNDPDANRLRINLDINDLLISTETEKVVGRRARVRYQYLNGIYGTQEVDDDEAICIIENNQVLAALLPEIKQCRKH
jgi:hypothetical protein